MVKTRRYRKKTTRRPRRKARIARSVPSRVHMFKRYGQVVQLQNGTFSSPNDPPTINSLPGWSVGTALQDTFPHTCSLPISATFRLDQVLNYSEFTALYDRYKIVGVKLKFMFQMATGADQVDLGSTRVWVNPLPVIDHTVDYDDAGQPISRSGVQQHGYCKTNVLQANRGFSKYIKPRVALSTYGATAGFSNSKSLWIDAANTDVEHYGFKAWISSWPWDTVLGPSGAQGGKACLTIQPIFYIACKDTQ